MDAAVKRQEEDLDEIHDSIKTIQTMSMDIHNSLQGQHVALEDLDYHMTHTSTSLQHVTDRIQHKAGGPMPCRIIVFLIGVAVVLLLLVIYL